jgi:hypothetical protein
VTARWVVDEVAPARDLNVTWQPISLFLKNEPEEGSDYHTYLFFAHRLLRVMEAVREGEGEASVLSLYWQYGKAIHHDQNREFTAAEMLEAAGLDTKYAQAFDDDSWDDPIRKRMDVGLELAGDDIGTPIIALENSRGDKQGYFGPVITRVPPTEQSLIMWDALTSMMEVEGFWELKRTRTERPEFGDRPA